jgi:hypothetical protein
VRFARLGSAAAGNCAAKVLVAQKTTIRRSKMTTRKHVFYGILALVSLLGLGVTQSARANFIATIDQVGTNVVATGSGTIDLTGLSIAGGGAAVGAIVPNAGQLSLAAGGIDLYSGISGPTSFGSGGATLASSSSGDAAGIVGFGSSDLFVPSGYLSGNPLAGTSTYNNATFASLGLTPGTYTWTWGTGVHADSFTLQIGPAGVPDSGTTVSLLGCALLGVAVLRRKLRC